MGYQPTIYINNYDNSCRYALGTEGVNPLIVIGINPSTADNKNSDRTITRVIGFASRNGFDSFVMLNLYPQRTPYPNKLDEKMDINFNDQNLECISELLNKYNNPTILAAWSEKIVVRSYFKNCLEGIFEVTKIHNVNWLKLGDYTKKGHPRHPLYAKYTFPLTNFEIEKYISKLK